MPNIQDIDVFLSKISQEHSWRSHELIVFKAILPQNPSPKQKVLLRASIPLIYSHWEGFVKVSTNTFANAKICCFGNEVRFPET